MPEARDVLLSKHADLAAGVCSDEPAPTLAMGRSTGTRSGAGLATPDEQENQLQRSAAGDRKRRTTGSPLPCWYPRTPLCDITAIVRAIERRRGAIQQKDGDDDEYEVTPEKRLLNSIDTMEKAVKLQLRKMEMPPGAKESEREKKVRTLLRMR